MNPLRAPAAVVGAGGEARLTVTRVGLGEGGSGEGAGPRSAVVERSWSGAGVALHGGTRAVFFGPPEKPLAGWLHIPEGGMARGAVVLCPALGSEELSAHRAFGSLAGSLQEIGLLVLRFDYRGTGDSAGDLAQVSSTEEWLTDVRQAISFVRACGARSVIVGGMRVGATLAARAAERDGRVDGVVLWDPCSGQGFLRQQRALKMLSREPTVDVAGPGEVELLSMLLPKPLAEDLGRLSLPSARSRFAPKVVVLERLDRLRDDQLHETLEDTSCTWIEAYGQSQLLDVEQWLSLRPERAEQEIVAWVDATVAKGMAPIVDRGSDTAEINFDGEGGLVEHVVELGPLRLSGVVSEPATVEPKGPTAVVLNAGLIHKAGPSRLSVLLCRELAAAGVRAVRFDLPGIGDSAPRPGQPSVPYPAHAVEDVVELLAALSPHDPSDVILIGLCSGGFHAVQAALVARPKGVCLVNPALLMTAPQLPTPESMAASVDQVLEVSHPLVRWLRKRRLVTRLSKLGSLRRIYYSHRIASLVDRMTPLWSLLDRTGISPNPSRLLGLLVESDVETLLLYGAEEVRLFRRVPGRMRRLEATGKVHLEVLDGFGHSLLSASAERRARAHVLDYVLSRFVADAGPEAGAEAAAAAAVGSGAEPGVGVGGGER